MIKLVISIFGIAVVIRFFYQFEKLKPNSAIKLLFLSLLFQIPFYFYVFFKELDAYIAIYIGIILIIFIAQPKIITFFYIKAFEKLHINIIDQLILQIKAGKSPKSACDFVFNNLVGIEKSIFSCLKNIFNEDSVINNTLNLEISIYFKELQIILSSKGMVSEQLMAFRDFLRLKKSFRVKVDLALQQAKAQALICVLMYFVFLGLAYYQLGFSVYSLEFVCSITLFVTGLVILFNLGRSFKWKT